MEIIIDTQTVTDAGFNEYLTRTTITGGDTSLPVSRYTNASSLVGGIIGSEGILYLGSKQIKLDGKKRQIIINDGVNDRVLIGGF